MSVTTATFTAQDKATLRTAAYGAVSLISAASVTGSPHKAATHGSNALYSATGPIGHVLAAKTKDIKLSGTTIAEIADHTLPALTAAVALLKTQAPTQADDFRAIVDTAVNAAIQASKGQSNPAVTEMARKITNALDAA